MNDASSNRDLKHLYQSYFQWLVGFLDESDPVGLVDEDDPGREYEIEARKIVPLVASEPSADKLAEKIHSVFVDYFDSSLAGHPSRYRFLAEVMIQKWRELRQS